ncbi:MAG: hypothetical protein ACPGRG_09175 [Marinomonas sp.]|jgi:hypothetical protein|uniref:EexN family lipoprotein n=1 Tax=Marinomonas pontica TaxID=264739 RepID=A0ABN6WJY5_9GAMM|nr:hypothetical protein [Marinomonas pontica]MCW8355786.1 hypothetical protein [Marinomonas pontica]BDX02097.1 hypothetical protein MACH16_08450 [Marinomonas pontica]
MLIVRIVALLFFTLILSGCDTSTEDLSEMNNAELRKQWRACAYLTDPSRNEQKTCTLYENECSSRKEQGRLACY